MGSMFHGKNTTGGGANNAIKSIVTRSGIKIVFNDDQKSLHIADASGNTWDMDGKGNIAVNAPGKLLLNGQDIEIKAENNISISAGNNLFINVINAFYTTTKFLKNSVTTLIQFFSGNSEFISVESTTIQSNELKTVGTNKLLFESKESIEGHSLKAIAFHSSETMEMTQQAKESEPIEPFKITLATVDFRPLKGSDYAGDFGFDWLRLDEPERDELPYNDILEGGYKNDTTDYTKAQAFNKMAGLKGFKGEYEKIPIVRPDTEPKPINERTKDDYYYVPYMSLYSKEACEQYRYYKPASTATLRILLEVFEDVEKLEFADNPYFDITPKILGEGLTAFPKGAYGTVTITCKKDFDTKEEGVIEVYVYPTGSKNLSEDEQKIVRQVAGKINMSVNNSKARKEINIAEIKVVTHASGRSQIGEFNKDMRRHLANILHQAMIHPNFIASPRDRNGKVIPVPADEPQGIVLDTIGDSKYASTRYTRGRFITGNNHLSADSAILTDLIDNYYNIETYYEWYRRMNCFPVFAFDLPLSGGAAGFVHSSDMKKNGTIVRASNGSARTIFERGVLLSSLSKEAYATLAHELCHGLQLHHVHRDETPLFHKNIKYIFKKGNTRNIMSYPYDPLPSEKAQVMNTKSTWAWQWAIMRNNL